MNKEMQNNIIVFTLMTELRRASEQAECEEVKSFARLLLIKVNRELTSWGNADA